MITDQNINCLFFPSEVVEKGGVDPLVTLLGDVKPLVQANAAVCLTNLAADGMEPWYVQKIDPCFFLDILEQTHKNTEVMFQESESIARGIF